MIYKGRHQLPAGYKFHTRSVHDHALKVAKPKVGKDPHNTPDKLGDIIDALIASGSFREDQREMLESMHGKTLAALAKQLISPDDQDEPVAHEEGEPAPDDEDDDPSVNAAAAASVEAHIAAKYAHMRSKTKKRITKVVVHNSQEDYARAMNRQSQYVERVLNAHSAARDADEMVPYSTKDLIMATHHKVKR